MSVQVAKSTGGSTPTAGRRTPLSLSGSAGKSSKTQSSNDAEKDTSKSDVSLSTSTSSNPKAISKSDKTDNTTSDAKKITDKSDKKNINTGNQTTENTSSAKEKVGDDKKKDKDVVKSNDKKQENGLNERKEPSKTNGHKDEDKKSGDKNDKSTGPKESSKKKELREQKEKDKELEEINTSDALPESKGKKLDEKKTSGIKDDTETKQSKKKSEDDAEKQKSKDEVEKESSSKKKSRKEPETPKKDEKKAREIISVTPAKETLSKQIISNQSISLLATEKDLKGFTTDGEEMESLVFEPEPDTNADPVEISTPGKILKIKESPPPSAQKYVYERQEVHAKNESVSIKEDKPDMSNVAVTPLERPQFTSSYRAISGRRSLRPSKEYSYQSTYRDTYRKINTELDYTTSSLNVTVGSEIPSDSSFSLFGRGKKRDRTPPVSSSNDSNNEAQMDVEVSPKSPKRAKLDFSGIIGIVASPVTLLRAKLSRAKIQSSTPNGKVTSTTKDDEEGVENVSVIATEELPSNDIVDSCEDVNIMDAEPVEKEENDALEEDVDIDIPEIMDDFKKPQQVPASVENISKRRMCNVM